MLRKRYSEGTCVVLEDMEGEQGMPDGLKGNVSFIDDAGQIHVNWENGRSLALIPGVDSFHITGESNRQRRRHEPQR